MKNSDHVACDSIISLPNASSDGSVSSKKYILKALINHVDTLANGHITPSSGEIVLLIPFLECLIKLCFSY